MNPLICLYEDRETHVVAVKLLIISIRKFHPELTIRLHFPSPNISFKTWIENIPNIELITKALEGTGSYNIKPHVLIDGLRTGAKTCLWLDTDIILDSRITWLADLPEQTLVSTLDPHSYPNGSNFRAEAFDLEPQKNAIDGAINSALVLVDEVHKDFLEDWAKLLKLPQYQDSQKKPVSLRNTLMLGDQDALSALVASKKYASLKVLLLKHPNDILHHQGISALTFRQRLILKNSDRHPSIIHAMASTKPWLMKNNVSPFLNIRDYYTRIFLELSPYVCTARQYEKLLTEDKSWLRVQTVYSKFMLFIFRNDPFAAGALQALVQQILKKLV
ncbi:hypothetical protein [Rhodoferax lacus]|uniref:hypothetical protein n=1 Tax=Rhodoferax lacus TaxID=2184758 RepID=UPI0011C1B9F7|nr:hypothetical protein [Rhodoferax lacus]